MKVTSKDGKRLPPPSIQCIPYFSTVNLAIGAGNPFCDDQPKLNEKGVRKRTSGGKGNKAEAAEGNLVRLLFALRVLPFQCGYLCFEIVSRFEDVKIVGTEQLSVLQVAERFPHRLLQLRLGNVAHLLSPTDTWDAKTFYSIRLGTACIFGNDFGKAKDKGPSALCHLGKMNCRLRNKLRRPPFNFCYQAITQACAFCSPIMLRMPRAESSTLRRFAHP